jgi:hypothetical protein
MEGTLDFYLKQGTALRLIYERAEPFLFWTQFIRPVQENTAAFLYRYDAIGMDADPKKKKPAHVILGGDFPEIDMSRPSITSAMTESRGFMVRIKRNVIREEPKGISEVVRAYKFAGYWMARFLNDNIGDALKAGATTPTWTPTAVWSAAGATPVDDLIRLEAQMEREGYPYALTDVLVHKDNWYELKAYLTSVDISESKQRSIYGVPVIKKDQMTIPVVDADVWKIKSGMTEGYALGLDRNNPAGELHYYIDNKFGTDTVSYNTIVNGVPTMQTADNLGFHFEQIEDPDNHDLKLKFWVESKAVVTEAYAAQYDSGI